MAYANSYSMILPILSLWIGTRGVTFGEEISSFVGTPSYCITNGSSALAYITPIDDPSSLTTPRSHVFPTPTKDLGVDCEMEDYDKCSHLWTTGKWSLQNSLYGKIRQAITDWRWEDLSVIKTYPPAPQDTAQKTYPITAFNHGEEFQITFSVLTEKDAHIFLCNGTKVTESTCYWAMLRSWQGNKTALRLCHPGEIFDTIGVWPLEPCKINVVDREHKDEEFLGGDRWQHITIKKISNKLTVSTNNVDLLTHPFRQKVDFSPSYILLQTRMKALWKLHKYAYIYCEDKTTEKLGPDIPIQEGQNCISMFIITCATCHVFFKFVADQELIYNRGFNTPNEKWTEIKLLIYSKNDRRANMYVTTVTEETTEKKPSKVFWAIDSIRQCHAAEHRFLRLRGDLSGKVFDCELVKDEKKMKITLGKDVDEKDTNCPENTIGTSCIPCTLFGPTTCTKIKYCESLGNAEERCYCSSGYRTRDCEVECSAGTYGHGCKKTCENCPGEMCNKIYGYCDGQCQNGLQGPKCDIPPKDQFLYPITMLSVEETRCQVQIPTTSTRQTPIWLQYKEVGTLDWKNEQVYIKYDDSSHTIYNLKPDTEYHIRAQLLQYDAYKGDDIEKNTFRTICRIVEPWEISISSMKNSAIFTFQQNLGACNISNYVYGVNASKEGSITTHPLRIFNLQPCKEYDLYIQHIYSGEVRHKSFTTDFRAPSGVKNITYIPRSPTKILMTWNPPSSEDCSISHYVVKHRRRGAMYCNKRYSDKFEVSNVEKPQILLSDLIPYSSYEVKITEVTDIGSMNEVATTFETLPKGTFEEKERPYITGLKATPFKVILNLKEVDCNEKRGQTYLKFEVKCQTDWCSDNAILERFFYASTSSAINLDGLNPYVNYTISMKVSRYETIWSNFQLLNETAITTPPSYPVSVADVLVTSKDEDFISLRWIPPFPPTGILHMYEIRYWKPYALSATNVQIKPSQCKLWPNHHCATIREDIRGEADYTIQIWARNAEPREFVSVTPKDTYAKASVYYPDPPTNVSARFLENNTLLASWKHPDVTNGVVEKFFIEVVPSGQNGKTYKHTISNGENGYKLEYLVQINDPKVPWCSPYKVQFKTKNRKFASVGVSTNLSMSPPPIPTVTKQTLDIKTSNSTLTVKIPALNQEKDENVNSVVYLLVSVSTNDYDVFEELARFETSLHNQIIPISTYDSRLVLQMDGRHLPPEFPIGDPRKNKTNPPLESGRRYSVNLFYVNKCHDTARLLRLTANVTTVEATSDQWENPKPESNNALYALLLLILLVPLAAYLYLRRSKESPLNALNYFKRYPRDSGSDTIPMTDKPEVGVKPVVNPQRRSIENPRSIPITTHSKPIKISEYESYVRKGIENGEFERQHALFPRGQTKPWDYGACKANKSKNRYNNLIAYDHTRVKLRKLAGVEYSDYINANFIDGYKSPRAYIATQGPKASTLNDFWRMIWQHKVQNIVMLAMLSESGKKKVEKYWPDINEEKEFQGIRVQYASSRVFADYEYRVFNLSNNGEQRKVEQLHFTSWPDHGVPLYSQSLVPFLQRILKIPNSSTHPVVVHCSAGVGRTGTIILCDICLRMAASEGSIDCLANLEHLRSQRPNMVDNVEQYKLVHLVVLELLFGMQTHIQCDDNMEQNVETFIASGGIAKYMMRYLEDTKWKDKAMDTVWEVEEAAPIYPEKNRFQDIVPEPQHRVFLARYPHHDERSSYINAVRVDGFRSPGRFIVTQQPMPNTVSDFWRMVNERKCSVIISLNDIDANNKSSCQFWPKNGADMKPVNFLTVRHMETKEYDSYDVISLHMILQDESEHLLITVVSLKNWSPGDLLPKSKEDFFSFWEEAEVVSRNSDPVIITCYDGATASGLYIAMSFVIDKMKLEHVCDVCLAVRNIRHSRGQFVAREEQFEFLYRISVMYINGFQPYANFA